MNRYNFIPKSCQKIQNKKDENVTVGLLLSMILMVILCYGSLILLFPAFGG